MPRMTDDQMAILMINGRQELARIVLDERAINRDICIERDEAIAECVRLTALNNKLTEDFNTLALDRQRWQDRAEKGEIIAPPECSCDDPECPKRHWSLTVRQAYENAVARLREAEAGLRSWEITAKRISEEEARQSRFDQCPKCGGDCSAANPPVYNCPMVGCNKDL